MSVTYENIYPADSKKPYDVRIEFTTKEEYLDCVETLENKGFLKGTPQFILQGTCCEEDELASALKERGYSVRVTTDGRRVLQEACSCCDKVSLYLYGFSQRTYDKSGKGSFEKTMQNMEKTLYILRKQKPELDVELNYVMYQFNMSEKVKVKNWAKTKAMKMKVVFAGFEEQSKRIAYLSGQMSTHDIIIGAKKYFFNFIDDLELEWNEYIVKYAGHEPIILSKNRYLKSEWDFNEEHSCLLDEVLEYEQWRKENQIIFNTAFKEKYAKILWIWNRLD